VLCRPYDLRSSYASAVLGHPYLHFGALLTETGGKLQPSGMCRFGSTSSEVSCRTTPPCASYWRRWASKWSLRGRGARTSRTLFSCTGRPVQLENIGPGHQHIDLIYFARPTGSTQVRDGFFAEKVGWYAQEDWEGMPVNAEVRGWCERALASLSGV
jgi:hypothetical protein